MKMPKWKFAFDAGDVSKWKYCPLCGSEILEVYPGDYYGHITCFADSESCDIDFKVFVEKDSSTLILDR